MKTILCSFLVLFTAILPSYGAEPTDSLASPPPITEQPTDAQIITSFLLQLYQVPEDSQQDFSSNLIIRTTRDNDVYTVRIPMLVIPASKRGSKDVNLRLTLEFLRENTGRVVRRSELID